MSTTEVNSRVLDAAYKRFPTFDEWVRQTSVDTARWDRYKSTLENRTGLDEEILNHARQIAKRAAAIDTGAIEGLYDVNRGFTYTVAFETAAWDAALAAKGEKVRSMFEAQLQAYDFVLTLATKGEPISEAAIRGLHEQVCRGQDTYLAATLVGPQEQALPKGQYKIHPNHVRTRKGTDHSYAPVDVTPAEMARLVKEMQTEAFQSAHPVLQASYSHYGLVVIHPFADGNGRVARALASTFTYRALAMPMVILSEQKETYFDALEDADADQYQVFVDFVLARCLDTIKLVDESIQAALFPSIEQSLAAIEKLYITKGGYTHEQVDEAGIKLLQAFNNSLKEVIGQHQKPRVSAVVNQNAGHSSNDSAGPAYRLPIRGGQMVNISVTSPAPAQANVFHSFSLWVPRDAVGDDDLLVKTFQGYPMALTARLDEVFPTINESLQIRLRLFSEGVFAKLLADLNSMATKSLGRPH
jgi:Fic family protein